MPLESPPPLPPASIEAEESVIASLLVDDEALGKVQGIIQPDDFFHEPARWAYEACLALSGRGEGFNQITVGCEMAHRRGENSQSRLVEAKGFAYLSRLVADLPTPIGVEQYARLVRRCAIYRALIQGFAYLTRKAYAANPNLDEILFEVELRLDAARELAAPILQDGRPIMLSDLGVPRALCPRCNLRFEPVGDATQADQQACPGCGLLVPLRPEPPDARCFAWLTGQDRHPQAKAKPGHRITPGATPRAMPGPGPSPPANPVPRPPQPSQPVRPAAAAAQLREQTPEELLGP